MQLITTLQAWLETHGSEERGATAVEYGLMVALIAVAIIGAVMALAGGLNGLFNSVTDAL
jgi:pilus assembly protein Flp/PilA